MLRQIDQLSVSCKQPDNGTRKNLTNQKTKSSDNGSAKNRIFQNPDNPVRLPGSEIVSGNRLHALIKSHHNHDKQKHHPVDNTVCPDIHIPSMIFQSRIH